MVRNGTDLGINVMSGLVKVDRVRQLGKPRQISVRVLGIPIYTRGFKPGERRPTDDISGGGASDGGSGRDSGAGGEEEDSADP